MKDSFLILSNGLVVEIDQFVFGEYLSCSEEATTTLGFHLGRIIPTNTVICLFGDLAAGKTTFIKGLVEGSIGLSKDIVTSPTYTYLNIYKGVISFYHFDLYRLTNTEEFLGMGFEEFFTVGGICCLEWSERIQPIIPQDAILVEISHAGELKRNIYIKKNSYHERIYSL